LQILRSFRKAVNGAMKEENVGRVRGMGDGGMRCFISWEAVTGCCWQRGNPHPESQSRAVPGWKQLP